MDSVDRFVLIFGALLVSLLLFGEGNFVRSHEAAHAANCRTVNGEPFLSFSFMDLAGSTACYGVKKDKTELVSLLDANTEMAGYQIRSIWQNIVVLAALFGVGFMWVVELLFQRLK